MVGDVTGSHERRAAGVATKIHQAAHRERHNGRGFEIAVRPGLPKSGNRDHHQRGIDGLECVIAKLESIEMAGRFVFNQHIGMTHQRTKGFPVLIIFQIENDAALIRVVRCER